MITFKYKKEKVGVLGETTLRPVARIYLSTDKKSWYRFEPYIDSGADITLLSKSTGDLIGLKLEKEKPFNLGGISDGIPIVYKKIWMRLGKKEFEVKVAWAQVHGIPPLLGRTTVFENFNITFKQKQGIIEFQEI